jgi:hypothetical protein
MAEALGSLRGLTSETVLDYWRKEFALRPWLTVHMEIQDATNLVVKKYRDTRFKAALGQRSRKSLQREELRTILTPIINPIGDLINSTGAMLSENPLLQIPPKHKINPGTFLMTALVDITEKASGDATMLSTLLAPMQRKEILLPDAKVHHLSDIVTIISLCGGMNKALKSRLIF